LRKIAFQKKINIKRKITFNKIKKIIMKTETLNLILNKNYVDGSEQLDERDADNISQELDDLGIDYEEDENIWIIYPDEDNVDDTISAIDEIAAEYNLWWEYEDELTDDEDSDEDSDEDDDSDEDSDEDDDLEYERLLRKKHYDEDLPYREKYSRRRRFSED
jgi:hypothetical protein